MSFQEFKDSVNPTFTDQDESVIEAAIQDSFEMLNGFSLPSAESEDFNMKEGK